MDNSSFDPTDWSHWLLLACFIAFSTWGLCLWRQWGMEAKAKRKRAKSYIARHLAMSLHIEESPLPKAWRSPFLRSPQANTPYKEFGYEKSTASGVKRARNHSRL